MKGFLIICFLVAAVSAAPTKNNDLAEIVNYVNNNNGLGTYSYSFETSDGIKRQEEAVLEDPKDPNSALIVTGYYTYIGDDNVIYRTDYVADRNGFNIIKNEPVNQKRFG